MMFLITVTFTGDLSGETTTVFGQSPEWTLLWAADSDYGVNQAEPNNQKGK